LTRAAAAVATVAVLATLLLGGAPGSLGAPGATPHRAPASRSLDVGFADILYESPADSDLWMQRTQDVNADVVRINLYWSSVAAHRPANPRDPADPAYRWTPYDRAIRNASRHGLDVDLTVFSAPAWAEGTNRPSFDVARAGVWRPDPQAYGDFAHALAVRYSGSYAEDYYSTLPAVKYFEAWNEPNLSTYIMPQWDGKRNVSSDIYGALLNSFYDEIKAVDPDALVVSGGTSPYGDRPGGPKRTQPLRFYQELLCLTPKDRRTDCPNGEATKFDIIAHHPINREDPPTAKAVNPGDIEIADFGKLTRLLRTAERLGTPATPGRHGIWANEVWWQTNPPDEEEGVSLRTHARWTAEALYLLWKQGADDVSFLQMRDAAYQPGESALSSYQTGIYTFAGQPKPTVAAVAFPFVTVGSGPRLLAWGIPPRSGRLTIKAAERGGGFRKVAAFRVAAGRIYSRKFDVPGRGRTRLIASVAGASSPVWVQRKSVGEALSAVRPAAGRG
jgi:hypothetical protein